MNKLLILLILIGALAGVALNAVGMTSTDGDKVTAQDDDDDGCSGMHGDEPGDD